MSIRAFAAAAGVSHTAIRKAIAAGKLQKSIAREGGKPRVVDVALALEEYRANSGKLTRIVDRAPANGNGKATQGEGLAEAQRRVTVERERALRLANERAEGLIYSRDQAHREAFTIARTVRDSILSVADRMAPQLAAETDAAAVQRILEGELRAALAAIADELERETDG
jgi:hypothetical protein